MNIVHIITSLGNGGAEGVLYRLVTHDERNNHIIISMMDEGKYGPLLSEQGFKVYCLNMQAGKILPKDFIKLYKYLKSVKPDVVQTWMYHADLLGGLCAKSLGIRKIFWNIRHSSFDTNYTKSSTYKVAQLNAKLSRVIPRKIISCAKQAIKPHVELGYVKSKIEVISNGYDLNTFKINEKLGQDIRDELEIGQRPVLGMVGRYDPQKDHHGLLQALEVARKKGYDFDLILVGRDLNETNKTLLEQVRSSGLYESTYLLDQRSDIPSIMNAMDIHILSSAYGEGFPNVIAEAMACGTPCIATNIGDSKLIVGKYGSIVEPNNIEDLATAIIEQLELLQDEVRWQNLRAKASQRIAEKFSIQKMVASYNSVWSQN